MLNSFLMHVGGSIGGRWLDGPASHYGEVRNPSTGDLLARVPLAQAAEALAAIESAAAARKCPARPQDRQGWLRGVEQQLLAGRDELARIITLEHGKTLRESLAEVDYAAGFFRFFAEIINDLRPHRLPQAIRGCRWTVEHRPAGVVGLITPWNFPLAMLAKKLAPALAAGCAVVAKPASLTPLSAIALWHVLERCDLPPGLANLVIGPSAPIGGALCEHPAVRLISFTGSTEVGIGLAQRAAPHLKRLTLELGGNAPFIVFADANLDAAVAALIANKFRASGQTCICTNRVYVERCALPKLTTRLAEAIGRLRVGDGLDANSDLGPLINRDGFDKVAAHVADAIRRGARRLVGGDPPRPPDDWGAFYPPTLLTGVTPEMLVSREETFGPVVAVSDFQREDEVIRLANGTPYGLAAYVFTGDTQRAERLAAHLAFGHIGVNTGTGPTPEAPFGGWKQSGYGREGGLEGLLEFCETQGVVSQ